MHKSQNYITSTSHQPASVKLRIIGIKNSNWLSNDWLTIDLHSALIAGCIIRQPTTEGESLNHFDGEVTRSGQVQLMSLSELKEKKVQFKMTPSVLFTQ